MTRRKLNVEGLGQVFTPANVVDVMLSLRRRRGRVLEPSCGDGAFSKRIPGCVAIELDRSVAPAGSMVMDFFAYPTSERFSTIIGNPPYVKYQDIDRSTRPLLDGSMFDGRSNLALFFIAKAVEHLKPGGELIFIVPREFIKLTAAQKMNRWLFEHGTITHWVETGDTRLFQGAVPNCAIFRYELGNFSRRTQYRTWQTNWEDREFAEFSGQLAFTRTHLSVPLTTLFDVKVGAVSGADDLFLHPDGNLDFVCSKTIDTGETRRMLYNVKHPSLKRHEALLLVVPPVPVLAVVLPELCVPAQLAKEEVTATRAYDPPVTSVPPPDCEQATVSRPTYQVAGIEQDWPRKRQSTSLFSAWSVNAPAIAMGKLVSQTSAIRAAVRIRESGFMGRRSPGVGLWIGFFVLWEWRCWG